GVEDPLLELGLTSESRILASLAEDRLPLLRRVLGSGSLRPTSHVRIRLRAPQGWNGRRGSGGQPDGKRAGSSLPLSRSAQSPRPGLGSHWALRGRARCSSPTHRRLSASPRRTRSLQVPVAATVPERPVITRSLTAFGYCRGASREQR